LLEKSPWAVNKLAKEEVMNGGDKLERGRAKRLAMKRII